MWWSHHPRKCSRNVWMWYFLGRWLDLMILEVFSNQNNFRILWFPLPILSLFLGTFEQDPSILPGDWIWILWSAVTVVPFQCFNHGHCLPFAFYSPFSIAEKELNLAAWHSQAFQNNPLTGFGALLQHDLLLWLYFIFSDMCHGSIPFQSLPCTWAFCLHQSCAKMIP